MEWSKLSMADRAKYIKLGLENNIYSLDTIRLAYNSYAEGGKVNKLQDGGETENLGYTPATLAGWLTQLYTGDDTRAAYADIGSSAFNIGADAIPVVGNIAGALVSIGDTLYDTGKLIAQPSWDNAKDLGMSALGILPGVGSVKDAKNIARAAKLTLRNVETTGDLKAITKTVARKSNPKSNVRLNVLAPDMRVARSYPIQLTTNPHAKMLGTLGNWGDTIDDSYTGANLLYPYYFENNE